MTHICVGNLTTIGSDNGLSPCLRQANIWTNDELLLISSLGTNFNEILIVIKDYHLRECIWKCRLGICGHCVSASIWCAYIQKATRNALELCATNVYSSGRENHWLRQWTNPLILSSGNLETSKMNLASKYYMSFTKKIAFGNAVWKITKDSYTVVITFLSTTTL